MSRQSIARFSALAVGFGCCAVAPAAPVTVTGVGLVSATGQNWITNGYATLDGTTSGVDWLVSGQQENSDWTRLDGANQGTIGGVTIEWPAAGTFAGLGYSGSTAILGVGPEMPADLGTAPLRIAEVTPTPGTYILNGVPLVATGVNQVLVWTAATVTVGDTMTFTHDAQISSGPIGFSTVLPEPTAFAVMTLAGLCLRPRRCRLSAL